MYHSEIFDNAFRFSSVDKRAGKRFSTKRPTGHFSKPKDDAEVKKELGASISAYFRSKGKGEGYEVDILDRKGIIYYFVYLEDNPRSGGIFKKGKYKREVLRTSFRNRFLVQP